MINQTPSTTGRLSYVCPQCLGALADVAGGLSCANCNRLYPVADGVPYLLFYGEDWYLKLREVLLYRGFCSKLKERRVERDRVAGYQDDSIVNFSNMVRYFDEACKRIDFTTNPRILDVGAGCGEVSQKLAERGAEVWAVDMNVFDLHHDVRWTFFGQLEGRSFYDIIAGAPIEQPKFRRAIADADYLPYPDASFDYVVLRSVAHHLYHLPRFMAEANRVLRPGGKLLLIAEPLASVLDSPIEYTYGDLDYEEGMNETRPYFYKYWRALRKHGFCSIETQCYFIGFGYRGDRLLRRLRVGFSLDAWLSRRIVSGPISYLLNITAGCMNLFARKTGEASKRVRDAAPNAPKPELGGVLLEMYSHPDLAEQIVRDNLPAENRHPSIDFSEDQIDRMAARGIRGVEVIAGKRARYLLSSYSIYLDASKAREVEMEYNADRADMADIRLSVNGIPTLLELQQGGWKRVIVKLQPTTDHYVVELLIQQGNLVTRDVPSGTSDPRDVGLAVRRVSVR